MGHRLIEEEMEKQNKEKYPGSFDVGQSAGDLTVGDHADMSWVMPVNYKLDVTMIHDLEDVKDVIEAMNLSLSVYRNCLSPVQQRLIDNGTFRK
jgi:hypothetical protein